jgi:S1-C subfamily serine protease
MLRVGDQVEIGLLREGKPLKVSALVAERSESGIANATDIHRGLEGADLADAPDGGGVLVRSVQEGSPASQAGLRANDLIVAVGRVPLANTKAFREAAKGATLLMLNVKRGSALILVPIR